MVGPCDLRSTTSGAMKLAVPHSVTGPVRGVAPTWVASPKSPTFYAGAVCKVTEKRDRAERGDKKKDRQRHVK